jgi:hypothetical protein
MTEKKMSRFSYRFQQQKKNKKGVRKANDANDSHV